MIHEPTASKAGKGVTKTGTRERTGGALIVVRVNHHKSYGDKLWRRNFWKRRRCWG